MCFFNKQKAPQQSIVPKPTEQPDKAPDPVEIKKDSTKRLRRKNPLRIERDSGAKPASGVSV